MPDRFSSAIASQGQGAVTAREKTARLEGEPLSTNLRDVKRNRQQGTDEQDTNGRNR